MDKYGNNGKLEKALADAERCVMCGLCLPHCPTFNVTRNEGESPRGRLLLMRALAGQQIEADGTMQMHFESCLHCMQCERVCPAQVPYGKLIDSAKQLLRRRGQATILPWWLVQLIASHRLRNWFARLVILYQRCGLQAWLRNTALFNRLSIANWEAMLPSSTIKPKPKTNATAQHNKAVWLFGGCIAPLCDRNTLQATQGLLETAGFEVRVASGCCGAIYQHSGHSERAQALMLNNIKAFNNQMPIVTCATGCAAQLQQYGAELTSRHLDIHAFLLKHAPKLRFNALSETVALHTPCTMRNVLQQQAFPQRLLERIPHLTVTPLTTPSVCCGAAGVHILQQQAQGRALANDTIHAMKEIGAKRLLTSNVGCAMHLRRAVFEQQLDIEVLHPAVLLYRQLATADSEIVKIDEA